MLRFSQGTTLVDAVVPCSALGGANEIFGQVLFRVGTLLIIEVYFVGLQHFAPLSSHCFDCSLCFYDFCFQNP